MRLQSAGQFTPSLLRCLALASVLVGLRSRGLQPTGGAADASDFDPGYLIATRLLQRHLDDGVARSIPSSTVVNSGCATAGMCLHNYKRVRSAPRRQPRVCGDRRPRPSRPRAQIIATVGKACGVSPKAILVILQKEQSLVTCAGARIPIAFAGAMGAGCPDTAPCDGNYAGLYEQVYYGAYLLKRYTTPGVERTTTRLSRARARPPRSCTTPSHVMRHQVRVRARTRRHTRCTSTRRTRPTPRRSRTSTAPATAAPHTATATSGACTPTGSVPRASDRRTDILDVFGARRRRGYARRTP